MVDSDAMQTLRETGRNLPGKFVDHSHSTFAKYGLNGASIHEARVNGVLKGEGTLLAREILPWVGG